MNTSQISIYIKIYNRIEFHTDVLKMKAYRSCMKRIPSQRYIEKIVLPNKNKIRKIPKKSIIKYKSPTYSPKKPMD